MSDELAMLLAKIAVRREQIARMDALLARLDATLQPFRVVAS